MTSKKSLKIQGSDISIITKEDNDYISLTDMLKSKDGDFFISDWLRNRNTIEFLSIWEELFNPNFNCGESAIIKSKAGLNNYKLSVKQWIEKTNSIGIRAQSGRYGGTYAHKDIAFEFGTWISAEFKVYLIREFQRLKEEENRQKQLEWNLHRTLTKINYKIHTDAIKENLIPNKISQFQINHIYASEADILNVALFGKTAKEWRNDNPNFMGNLRDQASIEQLIILSNLESINSMLIDQKLKQSDRLQKLNELAIKQMKSIISNKNIKKLQHKTPI